MNAEAMLSTIEQQRRFFASGGTRPLAYRLKALGRLEAGVRAAEQDILAALKADLGKSAFEGYTSEVGFVLDEIRFVRKNLGEWAKPRRVPTPLLHLPSRSQVSYEPRGVVLIIGPWNYPMMLALAPLIGALAAGNTAIIKPSELAPRTGAVLQKLIQDTLAPEHAALIQGGVPETQLLLSQRFDHIFFTGSTDVGRIVMRAAAEHLTPLTLELGGKSPCIVDANTDLKITARRIVWGKFYNCGQTCVAPDYLLVHDDIKAKLLVAMRAELVTFFGQDPRQSPDYGRIINTRHYDRLMSLLDTKDHIVVGGQGERAERYIAPTIVDDVGPGHKLMADEIFGPILPVLSYKHLDEAMTLVRSRPQPLALYVFTKDRAVQQRVTRELSFGGGAINNCLLHLANPHIPFGGIGQSGMGAYHGESSFQTFSHKKGLIKTPFVFDLKVKYPPYGLKRLRLVKALMRHA